MTADQLLDDVIAELDAALAGHSGEAWWVDCGLIKNRLTRLRQQAAELNPGNQDAPLSPIEASVPQATL